MSPRETADLTLDLIATFRRHGVTRWRGDFVAGVEGERDVLRVVHAQGGVAAEIDVALHLANGDCA